MKHAWEWPWSSASAHVTGVDKTVLLDMDVWESRFTGGRWKTYLDEGLQDTAANDTLRLATRTGHPLGSDAFVSHLEALTGRRLRPPKPGSVRNGRR